MRIGRIFGFELNIHWSTLVIFTLIVWSLTAIRLPQDAPGYGDSAYLIAALFTGVVFYASLLAHEVSHAVMARREGIEVQALTLWMLGGVATLTGEARSAGADLRVAGIGPAVSLLLAVAFAVVAGALELVAAPSIAVATVTWLAGINGVLALFNLIPAAPLDGGRILRAVLWRVRGDRTWAAVMAAKAGEAFGYALAGLGVARLFFGAGLGGLWFILLGWFVLNAARAEQAQTVLSDALAQVKVSDVMTADPVTAPDYVTIRTLLDEFVLRTRHSAFPLVGFDGRPAGLVTLTQVRTVPAEQRDDTRARDVACALDDVAVAHPDERLLDLLPRMNSCGQGRALVLVDDRLVGIVTTADVTRSVELATLDRPAAIDLTDEAQKWPLQSTPR